MKMQSERIPRSLLRGWRANLKLEKSLHFEDSLQLAAGFFNASPMRKGNYSHE
jgi:hypothetical protein